MSSAPARPAAAVSDWTCACGQAYRIGETATGLRLWPRSGVAAYSRHGLTPGACCIRCGAPLRETA